MPGPVLGLGAHVEHDHLAARQPLLELGGGDLLDPVALAQILVGEHAHLGHMADGDVADGRPQLADPLARQPVEDPVPSRRERTSPARASTCRCCEVFATLCEISPASSSTERSP